MSYVFRDTGLAQGISTAGSALGNALLKRGEREFKKKESALDRVFKHLEKEEDRTFQAGESALGRALTKSEGALGRSATASESELGRDFSREKTKEEREIQVETGKLIQQALSPLGANPNLQDVQGALASVIEGGGDPTTVNQFATQMAPFLKEQARTQGAQSMLQQLFGGQPQGGMGGGEGQAPQGTANQGIDMTSVPENTLVTATGLPYPELAKMAQTELQRRDLAQKRTESQRKYESEISTPFLKKVDESRDAVRQKEGALDLMEGALQEGNLGFFTRDNFANFLGQFGEGLRTTKGAQLLNAQKEFLLGNIQRAGARPNQWIEQQISNMLPKTGRSEEANLTVVEALRAETQLERKKIQLTDEIAQQYRDSIGYVPANIGALVDAQMVPFAQEVQDRLAYRLRDIHEAEMGSGKLAKMVGKKVPKGTPLTTGMAKQFVKKYGDIDGAIKNAEKLGYKITSKAEFQRWQK